MIKFLFFLIGLALGILFVPNFASAFSPSVPHDSYFHVWDAEATDSVAVEVLPDIDDVYVIQLFSGVLAPGASVDDTSNLLCDDDIVFNAFRDIQFSGTLVCDSSVSVRFFGTASFFIYSLSGYTISEEAFDSISDERVQLETYLTLLFVFSCALFLYFSVYTIRWLVRK